MDSIYTWLIQWFRDQGKSIADDPGQLNYFEAGLIDSMEVIGLIGDIEAQFDIQFEHDDFQKREFATVSGLAQLIESRQKGSPAS